MRFTIKFMTFYLFNYLHMQRLTLKIQNTESRINLQLHYKSFGKMDHQRATELKILNTNQSDTNF